MEEVVVPTLPGEETIELMSVSGIEILMVSKEQPSTLHIGTIGARHSKHSCQCIDYRRTEPCP